jgi:hypothetical protein
MNNTTNGLMAARSCTILGQRYVLMFEGCSHDRAPDRPCCVYSYYPSNFDISYAYPNDEGYYIAPNITGVIGGE